MTKDETFNGWSSYPTWNLKLWIDNEEPLHRVPVEIMKECAQGYDEEAAKLTPFSREQTIRYGFADSLKAWAEELFLDPVTEANGPAGPHIDILRWGWSHIDWPEIAQSYMDDNPEAWQE